MKNDILNRADIELLVDSFYNRVKADPVLKQFFKQVEWEKHLKIMYDFWENAIFYTGTYSGNPINVHRHIHDKFPLDKEAFASWLTLFLQTADDLFEGEKTILIKQKAYSIATVMQMKILDTE